MESDIANTLSLKYGPVGIMLTNERPEDARQFKEGRFGCVMAMLAAAARGKTAVFDRKTFGCPGGGTGLGFGNQYLNFPGGIEGFCYFLSVGCRQWEPGMKLVEQVKPFVGDALYDDLVHGERYIKTPELVKKFVECLPIIDVPFEYVVFKPFKDIEPEKERPEVVVFLADMDQLSALVVLSNYDRDDNESAIIPQAAGCQSIGIYPFREARRERPRAVVGLVDISARVQVKRQLKDDLMTFAVPFAMFQELEANIPGSFLERNTWKELMGLRTKGT
ncbi:MAG: DUF169 domain-containing protein [Deltaproteobacteria bacterium]|nr:DUF169 domain-containing protein [Deltaproteobacteria bacterium]